MANRHVRSDPLANDGGGQPGERRETGEGGEDTLQPPLLQGQHATASGRCTFDPLAKAKARLRRRSSIGSGLAGLTAANILGRAGHSVCLLEQHYNFGGLATWFKRRGGHLFDISLHGFPVGMKKTCRKYWNKEIASRIVQLEGVRFENPQFRLATTFTREDFTRLLIESFGVSADRSRPSSTHVRKMDFFDDSGQTTAELFEEFFPGRNDVHRLLMEPISYANGSTLSDPAITYGIVFSNFMSKGVFTFHGGTDNLIKEMRKRAGAERRRALRQRGQVERIVVEDGEAKGVEACGRFLGAPTVVSNANIKTTVETPGRGGGLRPDVPRVRARAVRLNNSSCQVFLGIRKRRGDPVRVRPHVHLDASDLRLRVAVRHARTEPHLLLLLPQDPARPARRATRWSARPTPTGTTGRTWTPQEAYEREKERLIEDTIDCLEELPARACARRSTTPRPPRRAPSPSTRSTPWARPSAPSSRASTSAWSSVRGRGPGLFHAGSVGIIMSGWLGAANYGAITANKVDALLHAQQASKPRPSRERPRSEAHT